MSLIQIHSGDNSLARVVIRISFSFSEGAIVLCILFSADKDKIGLAEIIGTLDCGHYSLCL